MTSYAQNHEDVVLARVFPRGVRGFYIDVGAADPVRDSLTKHFYDLGWSGINVEPSAAPFARLSEQRVRDVNLNVGLSDHDGTMVFHEFPTELAGCSTFSAEQAAWHREGGTPFLERELTVTTLAAVCKEHVATPIDFMSVDTEGFEREVLEGGDWERWRPRVVVVEAIKPNTSVPTHEAWESILLDSDYLFACFDGLNRFYVRAEDKDLLPALSVPANVTDDFVPYRYGRVITELRNEVESVSRGLAAARAVNATLRAESGELPVLKARYKDLQRRLAGVTALMESTRASLGDAQALYLQLHDEVADVRARCDAARLLVEGIDPFGLGVARRVSKLSARFPTVGAGVRRLAEFRLAAKQALGRGPG